MKFSITKFQAPNKFQFSNYRKPFAHWILEIGNYLVIGAWPLVI
jgi:hypothetical protein